MEAAVDSDTTAGSATTISVAPTSSTDPSPDGLAESTTAVEPLISPSTSIPSATPTKSSSRSAGKSDKKAAAAAAAASEGNGPAAKESSEKEERRSGQKSKSTRHNRTDHESTTEVEVKRFKKEPKDTLSTPGGDGGGSRGTPTSASITSSFATSAGYPASSYLQGLASLPHPYASLFAAAADPATAAAANAFLTASHFGYAAAAAAAPTDLSAAGGKDNGTTSSSRNHSNSSSSGALLNSLNQTETSSLKQLINGYRESAALLSRTADELESFLHTRK